MFRHGIRTIDAKPMSDLNTTPLIDVMLVLLIMFLVAIPVMTHKIPMSLPVGPDLPSSALPETHRLDVTAQGTVLWDGSAIPESALPERLGAMSGNSESFLEITAASEARYEQVNRILAAVARSGVENLGFAGNSAFAGAF